MSLNKGAFLLSLLLVFCFNNLSAQSDSLLNSKEVGEINERLNVTTDLLDRVDSVQKADSAAQFDLEKELSQLKARDKMRKMEVQASIDSVKAAIQLRNERVKLQVDSLRQHVEGIPVIFNKDTIFNIYSKLGPYQAVDRAQAIVLKLERLASSYSYSEELLRLVHGEETSDLYYDNLILLSITERDAFWMDMRRQDLALSYEEQIKQAMSKYLDENDLVKMFFRILFMLGIILVIYYVVKYMNLWFSKFLNLLSVKGMPYLKGLHIGEYELFNTEKQQNALIWLINLGKWVVIATILYLSVPLIFSLFPATEDLANTMIAYISEPLIGFFWSAIGFIPELIAIAIIILITHYIVRFLRFLAVEIEDGVLKIPGFYTDWAKPTFNLFRVIVYAFAFAVIFPYLPVSKSPVFQGVVVFIGFLIALGSMTSVGNIIAGIVMTYMRPFKIGDRVKVGETTGDVIEKTLLITRIRTLDNEEVTVPNSTILNKQTTNFSAASRSAGLRLTMELNFSPSDKHETIEEAVIEAAKSLEMLLISPKPNLLLMGITERSSTYLFHVYIQQPHQKEIVIGDLCRKVVEYSTKHGLSIKSILESNA